ncbi:hypothetical protein R70006_06192 [Paraburkholderia domus]|uniref:hypothetical protein n=1 Tax=Paraburkholderia domus TaxID=2793075 RepID=UPI001914927C|nr:hypothetical protein [Paraburkholderia domus]MBK5052825.1 hypothetical protein [Burkholderia sp. R-70006]CAE6820920.1 hypothetical protein R70006_06192 [Paraburkholderia domus]
MGEAKRRKSEGNHWLDGLTDDERVVAESARLIYKRVVKGVEMVQGCYYCAFVLRKYLKEQHGISVTPVVGWAMHGDILFAHAWAEFNSKRIDLSLQQVSNQDVPTGDLLILDHVVEPGRVSYQYNVTTTDQIAAAAGPNRLAFANNMREIAADDARIDSYFLNAPSAYSYDAALARINAR